MHSHHHALRDIRHHVGQLFRTFVLCFVLVFLLVKGELLGQVGQIARVIVGAAVLLFVPGWRITQAVFQHDELDILEMIALSFAFSITVVPLIVFYLNMIGIAITARLVLLVVIGVVTCSVLWLEYKK